MSFELETRTDVPAIVITLHAHFDAAADTPEVIRQFTQAISASETPIFLIADFRAAINRADMDNIQMGAFLATQTDNPLFNHPQVRENLFIAQSEFMKPVVAGLRTPTYGSLNVTLVSDLDAAIDHIGANLD